MREGEEDPFEGSGWLIYVGIVVASLLLGMMIANVVFGNKRQDVAVAASQDLLEEEYAAAHPQYKAYRECVRATRDHAYCASPISKGTP